MSIREFSRRGRPAESGPRAGFAVPLHQLLGQAVEVLTPPDLDGVIERLRTAGCVAAEEEAEELVEAATDRAMLEAFLETRERGVPLAWITGSLRFCGRPLHITPGVYVPRLQSEALARHACELLGGSRALVADLCTGAGAIAAAIQGSNPAARVVGVDIDKLAVSCARRNGVVAVVGDLGGVLMSECFDLVTAIAPYVPSSAMELLPSDVREYEPELALLGGDDGLDVVRRVLLDSARLLRSGGLLLIEIGGEQDEALSPTLASVGFALSERLVDEDDDLRGAVLRRITA